MMEPKQNRNVQLWIHAVCFVLVMVLATGTTVYATDQTGSLQLNCTVEGDEQTVYLSGDEYVLVQIAQAQVQSVNGTAFIQYQICPEYAAYDCDWSALIASQLREKAKLLAEAAQQRREYFAAGITDEQGMVTFEQLPPGLYLVMRSKIASENAAYVCEPFLASVPLIWDNTIVYEVVADPKFSWDDPEEPTEPTLPSEPERPSIPQTGQTNWPIPVLAGTGIACFIAGLGLWRKKENAE